jgi:predicted ester cyclase
MHEDFFGDQGKIKGIEAHEKNFKAQRERIPDGANHLQEMIAEGDKVAAHITYTGTFTGQFGDIEPTGKQVNITEAIFYEFKDGKVIGQTNFIDFLSFYLQSGIPILE